MIWTGSTHLPSNLYPQVVKGPEYIKMSTMGLKIMSSTRTQWKSISKKYYHMTKLTFKISGISANKKNNSGTFFFCFVLPNQLKFTAKHLPTPTELEPSGKLPRRTQNRVYGILQITWSVSPKNGREGGNRPRQLHLPSAVSALLHPAWMTIWMQTRHFIIFYKALWERLWTLMLLDDRS